MESWVCHAAFGLLLESEHTRDDIDITTDYVVYLAIRGEVERRLFTLAARELHPSERLFDIDLATKQPELFAAQRERFHGVLREVASHGGKRRITLYGR